MVTRSSCRILLLSEFLLSKTLIRGDILNNNGFLYAMLNRCGNFVAQIPQNWRKNRNDDLLSCMGMKCPQSIFVYALSQMHLLAQFVCHMLCSPASLPLPSRALLTPPPLLTPSLLSPAQITPLGPVLAPGATHLPTMRRAASSRAEGLHHDDAGSESRPLPPSSCTGQ